MKRIPFKAEFQEPILNGTKCNTSRMDDLGWLPGERRAAVAGKGKKPAFLTPVAEAFAIVECVSVEVKFWKDFTEEDAAKCLVDRAWYERKGPLSPLQRVYLYEFKVVAR